MRTTITLESDVEVLLQQSMKERGLTLKEAVNSGLREGLGHKQLRQRTFVQKTFSLGAEQNFRWDKALASADALEDEELSRKIALRK